MKPQKLIFLLTLAMFVYTGCTETNVAKKAQPLTSKPQSTIKRRLFQSQRVNCVSVEPLKKVYLKKSVQVFYSNKCNRTVRCRAFIYYTCRQHYRTAKVKKIFIGKLLPGEKKLQPIKLKGCKDFALVRSHKILCQ